MKSALLTQLRQSSLLGLPHCSHFHDFCPWLSLRHLLLAVSTSFLGGPITSQEHAVGTMALLGLARFIPFGLGLFGLC